MCLQFSRAPSSPSEDAMEPLTLPSVTTFLYFLLSRLCCCHSRVVFYPNSSSRGEGQDSIHPFLFSSARVLIAITNFRSYTGHTSTDTNLVGKLSELWHFVISGLFTFREKSARKISTSEYHWEKPVLRLCTLFYYKCSLSTTLWRRVKEWPSSMMHS
jgi:hypothetical protein